MATPFLKKGQIPDLHAAQNRFRQRGKAANSSMAA
jgi:hypothetical protein